jgi:hypothetical protein
MNIMSTLPEGREADYTGRGKVPGYSIRGASTGDAEVRRQLDVDQRLAKLAQAIDEPAVDTLSDLRRLLATIEYGDMRALTTAWADKLGLDRHAVADMLHDWATDRVSLPTEKAQDRSPAPSRGIDPCYREPQQSEPLSPQPSSTDSLTSSTARGQALGFRASPQPSFEEAPAKRPAASAEENSHQREVELPKRPEKRGALRAATSPTHPVDDGEGGSPGFGYNPTELT